jgi:hypothetical protein
MAEQRAATRPITWTRAYALGVVIALYFIVATVWLPSFVLKIGFVASAPAALRDLIGAGVWAAFLAGGLFALRRAQRSGLI